MIATGGIADDGGLARDNLLVIDAEGSTKCVIVGLAIDYGVSRAP